MFKVGKDSKEKNTGLQAKHDQKHVEPAASPSSTMSITQKLLTPSALQQLRDHKAQQKEQSSLLVKDESSSTSPLPASFYEALYDLECDNEIVNLTLRLSFNKLARETKSVEEEFVRSAATTPPASSFVGYLNVTMQLALEAESLETHIKRLSDFSQQLLRYLPQSANLKKIHTSLAAFEKMLTSVTAEIVNRMKYFSQRCLALKAGELELALDDRHDLVEWCFPWSEAWSKAHKNSYLFGPSLIAQANQALKVFQEQTLPEESPAASSAGATTPRLT